jgi:hypothetical protein
MAAKWGPTVPFCMPNGTKRVLLVPVMVKLRTHVLREQRQAPGARSHHPRQELLS